VTLTDLGLTHVALVVGDLDASVEFYAKYAEMKPIHSRQDRKTRARVAWISDSTRPFVLVLIEVPGWVPARGWLARWVAKQLPPFSHLGVACASREEVDRRCAQGKAEGVLRQEPEEHAEPVGYFGLLSDPDGNALELSYGQEVGLTVERTVD
jgi:catechol 2,3-dioxygenase-like lactoylglutathione lyase family enzyme